MGVAAVKSHACINSVIYNFVWEGVKEFGDTEKHAERRVSTGINHQSQLFFGDAEGQIMFETYGDRSCDR